MGKATASENKYGTCEPSDLDGPGYSDKSYRPGYPISEKTKDVSEDDVKRGFTKGG